MNYRTEETIITKAIKDNFAGSYQLLDSGGFEKLEKWGDRVIVRPSSLCLWDKKLPKEAWQEIDAYYDIKNGWVRLNQNFKENTDWIIDCKHFKLILKLQTNGQIGVFPEHAYYLTHLEDFLNNNNLRVLNLFAYSGMASMFSLRSSNVCHVDYSKKVLDWAKENQKINHLNSFELRLINDDALSFLKREVRRESKYDVVILDPPSFSRQDGKKSWKLEEVIFEFVENSINLLSNNSKLIFSCHHQAIDCHILENIFYPFIEKRNDLEIISANNLFLEEDTLVENKKVDATLFNQENINRHFNRKIPAGSNIILSKSTR